MRAGLRRVVVAVLFVVAAVAATAFSATAGTTSYASCAAVAAANPGAPAGEYPIVVATTTISEYCTGLSSASPQGYLSLAAIGSGQNFSQRQSPFYTVTSFTKVHLVPNGAVLNGQTCDAATCIDTSDTTFSSTVGGSFFGPTMPYATAAGCPDAGYGNVDLVGTNLAVAPDAFVAAGWAQWGSATYSSDNQVVDLVGGGWCGGEQSATDPLLPLVVLHDSDLALAPLPDATIDATSGAGATYSFTPVATDPGDPQPPAVSCDHTSGSVFPIGSTTVTCTATDANDENGPQSVSFTVTVRGAAEQAATLAVAAASAGGSYGSQIQSAQALLAAGAVTAAANQLRAFEHHVSAQSGKGIPAATADSLIAGAEQIVTVLGT